MLHEGKIVTVGTWNELAASPLQAVNKILSAAISAYKTKIKKVRGVGIY